MHKEQLRFQFPGNNTKETSVKCIIYLVYCSAMYNRSAVITCRKKIQQ